jgi:hypothetical protein
MRDPKGPVKSRSSIRSLDDASRCSRLGAEATTTRRGGASSSPKLTQGGEQSQSSCFADSSREIGNSNPLHTSLRLERTVATEVSFRQTDKRWRSEVSSAGRSGTDLDDGHPDPEGFCEGCRDHDVEKNGVMI